MFMGLPWTFRNFAPALPLPPRAYGLELSRIDSNRKAGFRDYWPAGGTAASGERFLWDRLSREAAARGFGRTLMGRLSSSGRLRALLAAIRGSPIVVRLGARLLSAAEWARIRKSPEVDAFVLAWIASHVRGQRRPPRRFM